MSAKTDTEIANLVEEKLAPLTDAIYVKVRQLEEFVRDERARHNLGKENPEVKAQQDASAVTNRGWLLMAQAHEARINELLQLADDLRLLVERRD